MPPYDISRIVECHLLNFSAPTVQTTLIVRTSDFTRYVFRPIAGHDILTSQTPGVTRARHIEYTTANYYGDTKDELRGHIEYDLHDYDRKNWRPVATKISEVVFENDAEGEDFYLEAVEALGELHVMNESQGWPNPTHEEQIATNTCVICQANISDEGHERMGLPCGHSFDKECLANWVWTKPRCPICRAEI